MIFGVSAWADMMAQEIMVATPTTTMNAYGEQAFGADVAYRCRIVGRRQLVISSEGEEVTSEQTVYLGSADPIDPAARLTLSTADTGSTAKHATQPRILATGRYPDDNGAHNSVIFI